ncbi:MAG TPA: hypothetical protein VLJ15_04665 [Gammaproteobacteria bacterium]|nr:hypothetical protein [Gammaproteobacteria bacterium]
MFQRVIHSGNLEEVLEQIRISSETFFDFSGTDFSVLGEMQLTAIFAALCSLPHTFTLRLNNCRIDEKAIGHRSQLKELTSGLSQTKNMERFEFVRSISLECEKAEELLLAIAKSLLENHKIKGITLDGYKVTPRTVCKTLETHPTAHYIFVDGLLKLDRQGSNVPLFKPAANEVMSNYSKSATLKVRRKK